VGGAGAGGRVAFEFANSDFTGSAQARGGLQSGVSPSSQGEDGTIAYNGAIGGLCDAGAPFSSCVVTTQHFLPNNLTYINNDLEVRSGGQLFVKSNRHRHDQWPPFRAPPEFNARNFCRPLRAPGVTRRALVAGDLNRFETHEADAPEARMAGTMPGGFSFHYGVLALLFDYADDPAENEWRGMPFETARFRPTLASNAGPAVRAPLGTDDDVLLGGDGVNLRIGTMGSDLLVGGFGESHENESERETETTIDRDAAMGSEVVGAFAIDADLCDAAIRDMLREWNTGKR
jgi:hypothetical protein